MQPGWFQDTTTVAGYSPDGKIVFVNREDRFLALRDADSGAEIAVLRSPNESFAWGVTFDCTGRYMAVASANPAVTVWQLAEIRESLRDLGLDWPDARPGAGFARRSP